MLRCSGAAPDDGGPGVSQRWPSVPIPPLGDTCNARPADRDARPPPTSPSRHSPPRSRPRPDAPEPLFDERPSVRRRQLDRHLFEPSRPPALLEFWAPWCTLPRDGTGHAGTCARVATRRPRRPRGHRNLPWGSPALRCRGCTDTDRLRPRRGSSPCRRLSAIARAEALGSPRSADVGLRTPSQSRCGMSGARTLRYARSAVEDFRANCKSSCSTLVPVQRRTLLTLLESHMPRIALSDAQLPEGSRPMVDAVKAKLGMAPTSSARSRTHRPR